MPGNHRCPVCKDVYPCTADECDSHYWLICTPCEHAAYDLDVNTTEIRKLRIVIARKQSDTRVLENRLDELIRVKNEKDSEKILRRSRKILRETK